MSVLNLALPTARRHNRRAPRAGMGFLVAIAATMALLAAGCGGGGGGTPSTPVAPGNTAGMGTIRGQVNSLHLASAQGGAAAASPQTLKASLDGTNITAPVNADGSFSLPLVPAGTYAVTVSSSDGSQAGHAIVQVAGNTDTQAVVNILPAGHVTGVVSAAGSNGAPSVVGGVDVTLMAASPEVVPLPIFSPHAPIGPLPFQPGPIANAASRGKPGRQTTTTPTNPSGTTPFSLHTTSNTDGFYDFGGVPAGFYQVNAVSGSQSATTFVSVLPAQASSANLFLQIAVAQGTAHITGTVTGPDSTGKIGPIQGAYVRFALRSLPCEPIPFAGVGVGASSGGSATGGPISTNSSSMSVAPTAAGRAQRRGRQAMSGGATPPPTLTGPPSAGNPTMVFPCVQPELGGPIAAGSAGAGSAGPGTPTSAGGAAIAELVPEGATTDSSGNYSFDVPSYVVSLEASAQGFQSGEQDVTLAPGDNKVVNFQLTPIVVDSGLQASLTVAGQGTGPITVASGAPFKLTLTLTNTATHPVNVTEFAGGAEARLLNSNGDLVWSSTFGKLLPQFALLKTLQPNESITDNETFNGLDNEGLALADGVYTLQGQITSVATNLVTINVTGPVPPNPTGPTVPIEPPIAVPGAAGSAVAAGPAQPTVPQAPTS